jgi:hypothetical protein
MTKKRSIALLFALAVTTGLVACGGDGDGTTSSGSEASKGKSEPLTIVVRNEEPVNGVERLEYSAGEQVEFKVKSDTATEVHVHGYEIEQEVPAGKTIGISFPAELEGIYEVEVHPAEEQIAELRVNP